MTTNKGIKQKIFDLVLQIPKGKIVYYGQIANIIGVPAQIVGWQLSGMSPEQMEQIPWQRVVAKNGFISSLKLGSRGLLQKQILLTEGYKLIDDTVDMEFHKFEFTNL